jgi:hypothetical protein
MLDETDFFFWLWSSRETTRELWRCDVPKYTSENAIQDTKSYVVLTMLSQNTAASRTKLTRFFSFFLAPKQSFKSLAAQRVNPGSNFRYVTYQFIWSPL